MFNEKDDRVGGERIDPSAVEELQKKLYSHEVDDTPLETGSGQALSCQSPAYGSYVSSASFGNTALEQDHLMTIDDLANNSGDFSETMPQHSQHISFYDSEESDGSIVFSSSGVNNDSSPRQQPQRNRLQSFDSVASTGSFQILPATSNRNSPLNNANNVSSKPAAVLPYDQRRKLSLKREDQPPPPLPSSHTTQPVYSDYYGRQPYIMDNTIQQQAQHYVAYNTAENETSYWLPPPHYEEQHQNPPMYHMNCAQGSQMQHLPPSGYRPGQENCSHQKLERGRSTFSKTSQFPHTHQPYSNHPMPQMGQCRDGWQILPGARGRTSSADDSSSPENERSLRYPLKSKAPPPPPPPPPPMPVHHHLRENSSGSVSSLGSFGDKLDSEFSGYIRREKKEKKSNTNFMEGLVSYLSPRQQRSRERKYSVEEFHEKNQEFLKKAKQQQNSPQQPQHSPKILRPNLRSDTPPRSRGSHQTLSSIENDVWEEQANQAQGKTRRSHRSNYATISPDALSSSEVSDSGPDPDERTSLLPPSGISSREKVKEPRQTAGRKQKRSRDTNRSTQYSNRNGRNWERSPQPNYGEDYRPSTIMASNNSNLERPKRYQKHRRKKTRKEQRKRSRRSRQRSDSDNSDSTEDSISSSSESMDYRQWIKIRTKMLEKERAKLISQWKAEAEAEAAKARATEEENRWYRKVDRAIKDMLTSRASKAFRYLALAETFISNLPSTIGAVALAIVTLGVVWFKYAEENLDSCEPVHFHSSQCSFPEFPGCFFCDTKVRMYRVAVNFHFTCSAIAGILATAFLLKILLATRVVLDELSSPTTASPAGLICMTTVCVFAGRGWVGQLLVSAAAAVHFCLAVWFIYCALAYHIMPDPSWFPNTVGIGLSAVKTWLYYPMTGHFLMAICLVLLFFCFPISLIRVTLNQKISAPVGWIQMSAPSIALYALTIMAQPSFEEEHPDVTKFEHVHRMVYLPCMHFLFGLAVLGVISSAQSLVARWDNFRKKDFSPAHAAFCFPTLAHANAIQAYRAALYSFSDAESGAPFKIAIYIYWVIFLVSGTVSTIYVTWKFFCMLPSWTQIDVIDEVEPPAPYETTLTLHNAITTGETLRQPFVSPAVLQANETGALIMLPRTTDGHRYIRTRRLPALGFEPTMEWSELSKERDVLLDWVGKNPPRRRKRTLSVPGINFNYGYGEFGSGNSGVYGSLPRQDPFHHRSSSSTAADDRHDISWQNY